MLSKKWITERRQEEMLQGMIEKLRALEYKNEKYDDDYFYKFLKFLKSFPDYQLWL